MEATCKYNFVHVFSVGIKVLIRYLLRFIQSTNLSLLGAFSKSDASIKGSQKGSLIPRSRLKFSLDPEIPTVNTGRSQSSSFCFFLSPSHNIKSAFSMGDDFLNWHRPVEVFDDIINFRSFQSFPRVTYTSHSNNFLPFNYVLVKTGQYQRNE